MSGVCVSRLNNLSMHHENEKVYESSPCFKKHVWNHTYIIWNESHHTASASWLPEDLKRVRTIYHDVNQRHDKSAHNY